MTFRKLSQKQKTVFRWCYGGRYKALICDGAVRSGKTVCMAAAFVLWAMRRFNGAQFGICGKTVRSAERNIITPLMSIVDVTAYFKVTYKRSESLLTVEGGGRRNVFHVFGGKDESSYMLIQGVTLSGVLFDEVALMPRSFVEQALARTLSVPDALYWFNCNPESRFHWFFTEWVEKSGERGALRLHFLMQDNPSLTPAQIADAEKMFSGVFYRRYILGEWVSAEGVIYREFADNPQRSLLDKPPDDIMFCVCGLDFGGNGSAHAAACVGVTRRFKSLVVLGEYYRKEVITPETLFDDVGAFVRRFKALYPLADIYCDSAETTLIAGMKTAFARERIPITVRKAKKGEINGRIRFCSMMMAQGRFFVSRECRHTIEALSSAVWDSKSPVKDVRLDDGNYNIDSLDALEYALEPSMKSFIEAGGIFGNR